MAAEQENASLAGQAEIWKFMFGFVDSMALRCVVELGIPDIIKNSPNGGPITVSQIANEFSGDASPDTACLARIMRLLVRRKIFTGHMSVGESEPRYGLTPSSTWLLRNDDTMLTLAPMVLMQTCGELMAPWRFFANRVRHSGAALFELAHGKDIWDYAAENPGFNTMFNEGMECTARTVMKAILGRYEGFRGLRSVVDVGGGTGKAISEIVRANPSMEGINFDLPHVVATAPDYPGVCHIGGDMFHSVPKADAVFMKWIMHDWSDEDCNKILENCRQSIPERGGKVIIVDMVLDPEGSGPFDDTALVFDLLMIAHATGKERTEKQWNILLNEAGFSRYKIIKFPAIFSVIEAYPL